MTLYTARDGHGIDHLTEFCGPSHDRYVKTYCDVWKDPPLINKSADLWQHDRRPPTCLICLVSQPWNL